MPSGEYTVKVVATTTDESANPVVTTDKKLNYTNPSQPSAPTFNGIAVITVLILRYKSR